MTGPLVNPYGAVNFGTATAHAGVTHMHGDGDPSVLTTAYNAGIRVMAFSNYYPEEPTDPALYGTPPAGVIFLPNSEQHSCVDTNIHYCPVGSTQSHNGGTHMGWRAAFDEAVGALVDPDGGGITINHPVWTGLNDALLVQFLDHDPRVLGMEIYNHMVVSNPAYTAYQRQTAVPMWDRTLTAGRRCWGFMAHDHHDVAYEPYLGFNMLLLDALTITNALRAYRDGAFYTTMTKALALTGFTVADHSVTITTDAATTVSMVTDQGRVDVSASSHTFTVPANAIYARFEATGLGDTLRTQPLMYRLATPPPVDAVATRNRRFMLGVE